MKKTAHIIYPFNLKKDINPWSIGNNIFHALKYKYKPQIRDGEAIEVPNVRTVVIFKIEDANKPVDYVPEGCA